MRIFIFSIGGRGLKIMQISTDADIWSTSIRDGQDVDFLISADTDIDADIYFQYLQMRMLKTMRIPGPTLLEMDRMLIF